MNISRSLILSVRSLEFEVVSVTNQLNTFLAQLAFQRHQRHPFLFFEHRLNR